MLESLKTPWWRLPLTLAGVGIVVIILDIVLGVGWIPFLVGLALLVYAAYRLAKGKVDGGPRLLLAACAGGIVLIAGLVWLHPQSWFQPGWTLPDSAGTLFGRSGSIGIFVNGDDYSARDLDGGDQLWEHEYSQPVSISGDHVLVRRKDDPGRADAYLASTGTFDRVLRWKAPKQVKGGDPTAKQLAKLPELGPDEHVKAQVRGGFDAARLVSAVDPTGHRYTRLDVVVDGSVAQYRVSDAEKLEFRNQVLVVRGRTSRVIPLLRTAGPSGEPSSSPSAGG